jgi:hypothetical protein
VKFIDWSCTSFALKRRTCGRLFPLP